MNNFFRVGFLLALIVTTFYAKPIELTTQEKEWIKNNPVITYSEVNWKPLSIIEDNRMKGIMGDFLDIIAQRTGLKFNFVPSNSWPHVLEQFSQGKIDIVPGIGSSPQETKLGLVSSAYATYPMVIVTSDKFKYVEGLQDLSNNVIAVPKYYTSYNFIVQNFPHIKLITTSNIPEALLLVEEGKADAFVGHIATSLFYISENHFKDLKVTGSTSFKFEHHYLVDKNKPLLLSIINKTFASISYQEKKGIYSKWVQPTIVEKSIDHTITIIILVFFSLVVGFMIYRQKLLKQAHQDMLNILNSSIDGILISKDGVCINANESAMKIFNCTKKQIIGIKILDLVYGNDKEIVNESLKNATVEPYEVMAIDFAGNKVPLLVQGRNLVINNENVRVSSFVDLTETKQNEALLYQQSKIASLGEMIGNIAHQWRQPLASISGYLANMKLSVDLEEEITNEEIKKCVENVDEQCQYLSTTIDNFRNFFIADSTTVEEVNLKDTILKVESLTKDAFVNNSIQIIKDMDDCEININESTLIQALINIFNNAKDAIKLNEIDDNHRYIFISLKKEENKIILKIKDNAGGINEDIIDKIFDPYYTTKHKAKGTGIGLYMTNQIITKHINGSINACNSEFEYEDKSYKGAVFTIEIPLN